MLLTNDVSKGISVFIILVSYCLLSYADDSEIFFSAADKVDYKPNVLFLIDYSRGLSSLREIGSLDGTSYWMRGAGTQRETMINILTDPKFHNLRMGMMAYPAPSPRYAENHPIIDIDGVDYQSDINKEKINSTTTRLKQRVLVDTDYLYQQSVSATVGSRKMSSIPNGSLGRPEAIIGVRFDNILIKNPKEANISADSIKATLELTLEGTITTDSIEIYLQNQEAVELKEVGLTLQKTTNTRMLNVDFPNTLHVRRMDGTPFTTCTVPVGAAVTSISCDVTGLVKSKIAESDWQDGYAMTFLIQNQTARTGRSIILSSKIKPTLLIEANNRLIAKNKMTKRFSLLRSIVSLSYNSYTTNKEEYIINALLNASKYIAKKPGDNRGLGPYHWNYFSNMTSPITHSCQPTHLVVLGTGQASRTDLTLKKDVVPYLGVGDCDILTGPNDTYGNAKDMMYREKDHFYRPGEACGRSLVAWLSRVSHGGSETQGNYIYTHTIYSSSDDLQDPDNLPEPFYSEKKYMEDLAAYGGGKAYLFRDTEELTEAFNDILVYAMNSTKLNATGQVALSSQSKYEQRREAFYNLSKVEQHDYWSGNVKGFKIVYKPVSSETSPNIKEQAVLYSWHEDKEALDENGALKSVSSAWSDGLNNAGNINKGGIVGQLPDTPLYRSMYTNSNQAIIPLASNNIGITMGELGVTSEERKKGLLDFIRGYTYKSGGSSVVEPSKKIGDSTNAVTLVSYGCDDGSGNSVNSTSIVDCDFTKLASVGLTASNDGFFRGIDLRTGKILYEFMPQELLKNIDALQKRTLLSDKVVRTYGLDSKVVVYHDDTNNNGYIDGHEKAYAVVSAGRGGNFLYCFDISNESFPNLLWSTNDSFGFEELGETWSEPAVGKVAFGGSVRSVAIFGGGLDRSKDYYSNTMNKKADKLGHAIYMVDLATGRLIMRFSENMHYSIAGGVALLTDEDTGLITDIFFGDVGGQLWRLAVNNGETFDIITAKNGHYGVVAKGAGYFFQKPIIYQFKDNNLSSYISVNLGSGNKVHPLQKSIGYFYSLRFPLSNTVNQNVIDVADIPTARGDNMDALTGDLSYGFKVILDAVDTDGKLLGEHVLSNALIESNRLVFNTYVPDGKVKNSCTINLGGTRSLFFDIVSGQSLLKTSNADISNATDLPSDIIAYCGSTNCTIVTNKDDLSGKQLNDVHFFDKPKANASVEKTSWTDLFDPHVQMLN